MATYFGFDEAEILVTLREFESNYEVVDYKMPFWLVWKALAKANGTWTSGVSKA